MCFMLNWHFPGPMQELKIGSSYEKGMWHLLRVLVLLSTTDAIVSVMLVFAARRFLNIFLNWKLQF